MKRIRSLVAALAALAISASIAYAMPLASNDGLNTARDASRKDVPMGTGASGTNGPTTEASPNASGQPTDTHGFTVSQAAHSPTPSGFKNHGAFVSSIAKTNGDTISDEHQNAAASGDLPSAADKGLANKP